MMIPQASHARAVSALQRVEACALNQVVGVQASCMPCHAARTVAQSLSMSADGIIRYTEQHLELPE